MRDPEFQKLVEESYRILSDWEMLLYPEKAVYAMGFTDEDIHDLCECFVWLWNQKNKQEKKKKLIAVLLARQNQQLHQRRIEIAKELEYLNRLQK